jgi:pathogenesis-related protein 1
LEGTGQNIAFGYPTMTDVVNAWYNEVSDYNYVLGAAVFGQTSDHFTQIVWKGTTDIGCASKSCPSLGGTFYICDYSPPGNYIGQYSANVFAP